MRCCARIHVIRRCTLSRLVASGPSASASTTEPWRWSTRVISCGSGLERMPSMTDCLIMGNHSPGVRGLCYKRQEVESTGQWGKRGRAKGLFGRPSPLQCLTLACRRPPIASARPSLRLSAAPEARRSAVPCKIKKSFGENHATRQSLH